MLSIVAGKGTDKRVCTRTNKDGITTSEAHDPLQLVGMIESGDKAI